MAKHGFRIVSGGTDNHLFLVDIQSRGLTGKDAQPGLDRAGITVNKNAIPFDPLPPMTASGIRMGTPAITTRGMREADMEKIAAWIAEVLMHLGDGEIETRVRGEIVVFTSHFPLYAGRW
jgi:glycine hydroxymethyltransferase